MSVRRACLLVLVCVLHVRASAAAPPTHVRVETANGPVHVWTPAHYDPETAGIVVYVHGFYTTVDRAWKEHRLASQFRASGINALFIACEAPVGPRDAVKWTSIGALLDEVTTRTELALPAGRVAAVGHSGAHRTLSEWLAEDRIATLVLVDAYFGEMPTLRDWLAADPARRLIDVAEDARPWADELHATLPDTLVFDRFPSPKRGLEGARHARIVYVRSQIEHMALVTGGRVLPMLLRALQLPVRGSL